METHRADRSVEFGLFFFAAAADQPEDCYHLLLKAAKYADTHSFRFVSTPERHFGQFGGPFPNPAVTTAALTTVTNRIQLRAGSLISPLRPIPRIVEDWTMLDQLSGGRVAVSFGSGWHINDFTLAPEAYQRRRDLVLDHIMAIRAFWTEGIWRTRNPLGHDVSLPLYPRPVQPQLPIWLTASGRTATFEAAGRLGTNVLTHLEQQDLATLTDKIAAYRAARAAHHHSPDTGIVTIMQHTYIAETVAQTQTALAALRRYLNIAIQLEAASAQAGGRMSGGRDFPASITDNPLMRDELLDQAVARYQHGASLIGTLDECVDRVRALRDAGADEIACLIDFHPDTDAVLHGLNRLNQLREAFSPPEIARRRQAAITAFLQEP